MKISLLIHEKKYCVCTISAGSPQHRAERTMTQNIQKCCVGASPTSDKETLGQHRRGEKHLLLGGLGANMMYSSGGAPKYKSFCYKYAVLVKSSLGQIGSCQGTTKVYATLIEKT